VDWLWKTDGGLVVADGESVCPSGKSTFYFIINQKTNKKL
jgi:hypothetical protein